MIDRKLEPLVKRQMTKYLGELEDDDLIMFVLEHLKDHKGPQKLVEGLEPVRLCYNIPAGYDTVKYCYAWLNIITIYVRSWKKKLPSLPPASGGKSFSKAWRTEKASTPRK